VPTPASGVRPPQQRRSRESLERLLRAGEKILARDGYEGFTIAEVSRLANVSVGSVYGRFENKDALVYAIHRRMMARMSRLPDEMTSDGGLGPTVRAGVRALANDMHRERALLRAFMLRGAVDPRIAEPGSRASQMVADDFRERILRHRHEIAHHDPEVAADVAFRTVYDVLARQVMYGPTFESPREISWDLLVEELIQVCMGYLGGGQR
jgi:AcrR family transcriptional regulator